MKFRSWKSIVVGAGFLALSQAQAVPTISMHEDGNGVMRHLNLQPSQVEHLAELKGSNMAYEVKPLSEIPETVDNRHLCSPVPNQEHLGSCTGFASKNAVEMVINRIFYTDDEHLKNYLVSALYQYFNERYAQGTIGEDSGATIAGAIMALHSYGICQDSLWNYDDYLTKFKQEPPQACYDDAENQADVDIVSHAQIDNTQPTAVNLIRSALAQGDAIIVGINVYSSFMSAEVAKTGVVPMPDVSTEKLLGGHALHVVGYKEVDGEMHYIIKNSWGAAWGDKGYCYIPAKFIEDNSLTSEVWTLTTVGKNDDPSQRPVVSEGWINWALHKLHIM